MAGKVAVVYHPDILTLDFGEGHPLRGDRFRNFMDLFSRLGLDKRPDFELVGCEPATDADLLLVHTKEYIAEVNRIAKQRGYLSIDTPINEAVVKGTCLAVGGALEAGRRVVGGKDRHAMCFGGFHHAGADYGSGFCVYNDVAILARALVQRHDKKRIMIIDTDAHAGDGTQEVLAADKEILMVTLHQDPRTIYPGRGFPHEIGKGDAKGQTVNIPMPPNSSISDYERAFGEVVIPLGKEFRPEILIRNGGSDPHYADELTQLGLNVADFRRLGQLVRESAPNVPMVDMYGSGYNPIVLPSCWLSLLSGTTGIDIDVPKIREGHRPETHITPGLATPPPAKAEDLRSSSRGFGSGQIPEAGGVVDKLRGNLERGGPEGHRIPNFAHSIPTRPEGLGVPAKFVMQGDMELTATIAEVKGHLKPYWKCFK